jgi:two-component system chemotaxis response regulator CheB
VKEVLTRLPADSPPIVITQHIPKAFSAAFATRMDGCCPQLKVLEATHHQDLMPGHVYIAPGDRHLLVMKKASQYVGFLNDGPEVNHHKPSVDVMFRSLLDHGGNHMLVVLLTGMGADGAQGMLELKRAGAHTIVQDQASSVVWGMPGAAVKLDAQCDILPLLKIPGRLIDLYQ